MAFELNAVADDNDLGENFMICRSQGGSFGANGWQDTKTYLPAFGVVSVASDREIQSLPEADRVNEVRSFISSQPLYTTSENRSAISDILLWNGMSYRVLSVGKYCNRGGFYSALATRMQGS